MNSKLCLIMIFFIGLIYRASLEKYSNNVFYELSSVKSATSGIFTVSRRLQKKNKKKRLVNWNRDSPNCITNYNAYISYRSSYRKRARNKEHHHWLQSNTRYNQWIYTVWWIHLLYLLLRFIVCDKRIREGWIQRIEQNSESDDSSERLWLAFVFINSTESSVIGYNVQDLEKSIRLSVIIILIILLLSVASATTLVEVIMFKCSPGSWLKHQNCQIFNSSVWRVCRIASLESTRE